MKAASPSASGLWWRSIGVATVAGSPQRRIEHAADERVVDAELAALLVDALLGRPRAAVDLRGVAGVGVQQHQLADVVQQARDGQAVAVLVADLGGDAVGGVLGGQGVQAEALGRRVPDAGALEEVEGAHAVGDAPARSAGSGARRRRRRCRRARGRPATRLARRSTAMISATSDSTAATTSAVATWSLEITDEQAVARLGERGKRLEGFEGHRQAAAVPLVLVALAGGAPRRRSRRVSAVGRGVVALACSASCCVLGFLAASRCRHSLASPSLGSPAIRAGDSASGSYRHPRRERLSGNLRSAARQRAGRSAAASPRGRAARRSRRCPARPSCR